MAKIFGDRWLILHSVGEGGQAHTFKVKDLRTGSDQWILKRLKNANRLHRFAREIEALKIVRSPNIPRVEDYSTRDPAYLVVPDLGRDLTQADFAPSVHLDVTLKLFHQLCASLLEAHKAGVVHRDIKPNNIVLSRDHQLFYLIDFGLCQYAEGTLNDLTIDEALGNPAFAAPECFLGSAQEPGPACDMYSLGKVLYWLLSGHRYIHREDLRDETFERLLIPNPIMRFYVSRLIRGTVKLQPEDRWNAQRLLGEVSVTLSLSGRLHKFEQRGLVVVDDRLGPEDSFEGGSSRTATSAPDYSIGTAFDAPADADIALYSIEIALRSRRGPAIADIAVCSDAAGAPSPEDVLERFNTEAPSKASIVCLRSATNAVLRAGARYWVLLRAQGPAAEVSLLSAPISFMPLYALIAEKHGTNDWRVAESKSGPGYAVRILGRATR